MQQIFIQEPKQGALLMPREGGGVWRGLSWVTPWCCSLCPQALPGPQHQVTMLGEPSQPTSGTGAAAGAGQAAPRWLGSRGTAGVGKGRTEQQLEITCLKLKGIYFTELWNRSTESLRLQKISRTIQSQL